MRRKPIAAFGIPLPRGLEGDVIALIDSLKQHDPDAFAEDKIGDDTPIANAFIVITGEPMTPVSDEAVA